MVLKFVLSVYTDRPNFNNKNYISADGLVTLHNYEMDYPDGTGSGNNPGYGWKYDFKQFYDGDTPTEGVILPSVDAAVFELKYPKKNIRGVVK